jgi:hypothetical protein
VGKSKSGSRNQGIVHYTRTTAMPTSVASAEPLLLSPALGRIGRSNRKESVVNGTHSSPLYRMLTMMTTSAGASASAL